MTDISETWRGEVNARLGAIEQKITVLETQSAVDEVHRTNVEKRLTSIENTLQWLVRLILGALILAMIGFAMSGGFSV